MVLYLEDLQAGARFRSAEYEMTEEKIVAFAREYDPQPFHLQHAAAKASVFGRIAASGWHTAAVTMRLLVTSGLPFANGLIGLGGEVGWPRPTYPGDVLHVESEIVDIRPSRSKPQQGIVTVKSTTWNQRSEEVQTLTAKILAFRRPIEQ
jgi:acyl dehydratase